jgi:hypothetical protein
MCSEARKDAVLRKLLRRGDPRGRISAATFYHSVFVKVVVP